jgi:protein TonB
MSRLPPEHPPIKNVASADSHHHSFWHDAGRWLGAGIIVLSVHAAGAYAVHMTRDEDQPDGAQIAAMVIELAPEPEAPMEEQVSEAPQQETAAEPEEQVEPEPVPEEIKEPEPEPEPEPVQEPEEVVPDVVEAPKPEVAVPLPIEKPEPKPEKKVEKPKPEKPKPVQKVEKPKPKKAEKAKETKQASAPRMDVDSGAKAVANRRGDNNASAGVSSNKWQSKLYSHLLRRTRSLQRKAGNGVKGTAQVTFVIDSSGNILSVKLAGSSGNPTVDQLAVEATRNSSPVPAPPAAIAKPRMPITVPIQFK